MSCGGHDGTDEAHALGDMKVLLGGAVKETTFLILAALAQQPSHGYDLGRSPTELSQGDLPAYRQRP
jgi:hypothetical protein